MKRIRKRSKAEELSSTLLPPGWRERLRQGRVPLAVCGLALAVYSRSLFCGFVRDDFLQIVNNPQVQSWEYLPQILTSHLWSHQALFHVLFYRPLFSLWMLVIHTLGGLSPWFWHLSSILLHVACTYLVYRLSKRLLDRKVGAVLAAALFAIHPIHVEAVTWVSASNELLFSGLLLGAMLALVAPRERGNRWPILASAVLYFTSLFAKETGVALIVLLIAMAWIRQDQDRDKRANWSRRLLLAGGPYVVATGAYLIIRWSVMHVAGIETGEHSWRELLFSSPSILMFYLRRMIVPVGLSGGYVNPIHSSPTMAFWLPLAVILLFVLLMTWLAFRRNPVFGFSAALILLPLLPPLAGIRLYPQGDMTHDRYLYLPSVGLCLMIGALAPRMIEATRSARIASASVLAGVLVALSVATFAQQRFFDNDLVFLQREIDVNPANSFAYSLLGNAYMSQGKTDLGFKSYRIASDLAPDDPKISLFLVRALFAEQKYDEAESILNRLMLRKDLDASRQIGIRLSLANVEISLGKLESAERLLQQVEQEDANFPELHWALGILYQKRGQIPLAQAQFEKEYEITGDEMAQRKAVMLSRQILLRTPPSDQPQN